ncbi:MAG: glycosyltransferase family 2 protein [Phycisphaerales bacterium]|nr:MAG: glycosyltransferase family 2 protein [Phycisphaerales bacterium]
MRIGGSGPALEAGGGPMHLSVLIPTCGRPEKLDACLRALSRQTLDDDLFEVVVGVDGPGSGEVEIASASMPSARVFEFAKGGPAATRNRLIEHASGRWLLWLNDDVAPGPDCVRQHLEAQISMDALCRPAMVLGAAPWKVHEPDRLFDRLVRETSMVFFYDQMRASRNPIACADPLHDWGFRHAWTLNLSVPAAAVREIGGFDESLPEACFEDLEWAWRLREKFSMPVLFRPGAVVVHDHRYEPEGYLERERKLGEQAWLLAGAAPLCARAIFGRDLRDAGEIGYARAFVDRERAAAERLEKTFCELAKIPATAIDGPHADALIETIYQQHLLLKRWCWRRGLVEAAERAGVQAAA